MAAAGSQQLMQDGQSQAEDGDWVAARLRFEQILMKDPENLDARLGLARALRDGELYEPAATHLLYIIDRAPDMKAARIEFSEMLYLAGQLDESRKHLTRAAVTDGPLLPRANALTAAHAAADATTRGRAIWPGPRSTAIRPCHRPMPPWPRWH